MIHSCIHQKPYFLLIDGRSEQPYWLLYNALKKSGKVGIARFATYSREHLGLVRPANNLLTLNTLYYPSEIREVSVTPPKSDPRQMELALSLIDQQTIAFQPDQYSDRYMEALEKLLEKKKPVAPAAESTGQVVDLMEELRTSIEEVKNKRSA